MMYNRLRRMKQERVLAIHDISCVGKCSLTVALPIISAAGEECSVLPTAVLSTHTGGFTGFTFRDLTEDISPIGAHWKSLGLRIDAIYTGFLGSFEQIDLVKGLIDDLSDQRPAVYVDPVMADKGKMYAIFGPDFPAGMRSLCEKADLIMPNLTELAFMLGFEYEEGPYSREYIDGIFSKAEVLGVSRIVITGVSFEPGKLGAVWKDYQTGETGSSMRKEVPGYYHGTGDIFGSALVGALEAGVSLGESVDIAVDFTVGSIIRTYSSNTDVRFGVNFECGLIDYARSIKEKAPYRVAINYGDFGSIEKMASAVWHEAYAGIVSEDQIDYMLAKFQSAEAIKNQISEGLTYEIARRDGKDAGYIGYKFDGDELFVSKIYVMEPLRKEGVGKALLLRAFEAGRCGGSKRMRLTVNKNNSKAIAFYEAMGLEKMSELRTDIGEGFVMDDFVMGRGI